MEIFPAGDGSNGLIQLCREYFCSWYTTLLAELRDKFPRIRAAGKLWHTESMKKPVAGGTAPA